MAVGFTEWTVLEHRPIEKLHDNLWTVSGSMPNPSMKRKMSLARMSDGRVLVHNAIALEEGAMKEIEAWGEPAFLVVPNAHHRQDAFVFKQRYPKIRVVCPRGIAKAVGKAVAPELFYDALPADPHVQMTYLDGMGETEGYLRVQSGDVVSTAFTDVLCNQKKLGGMSGFMASPTGCLSVPRVVRWALMKDRAALKAHLARLAAEPGLTRVIVAHGSSIHTGAADHVRAASERL